MINAHRARIFLLLFHFKIKRLEPGREIGVALVGARIVITPCYSQHPSGAFHGRLNGAHTGFVQFGRRVEHPTAAAAVATDECCVARCIATGCAGR